MRIFEQLTQLKSVFKSQANFYLAVILLSSSITAVTAVSFATTPEEKAAATPDSKTKPTSWSSFRNGNQQLGIATTLLPEKLDLLWKITVTDGVTGTAAIVKDRVYIPTFGGELICAERKTGKRIWTYFSAKKEKPDSFIPAFKSSPTITPDFIFLGDEDGVFHAIETETGKQKWQFITGGEIISSASIAGDRVLFGSYDNSLYCLDKNTGKQIWKFETDGYVNCSPAIIDTYTFVTGCDEHLRVINIETGKQEFGMPLMTYLIASPAVIDDILYVGTYASEVIAVDWKKQDILWRYKDPVREFPYHASTAVNDSFIVIGGRDKQVHCIDRKTGGRIWVYPTKGRVDSSPVIAGNRVFIGSSDKNFYEFDLKTGDLLWKFNAGDEITASPAIGEGTLVIGTQASEGTVYCFGTKDK